MKRYYKINGDKTYGGDMIRAPYHVEFDPMPENVTEIRPADGLYRAEWTGSEWVETGSAPEAEEREPTLTVEEQIEQLRTEIYTVLVGAGAVELDAVPDAVRNNISAELGETGRIKKAEAVKT